MLSGCSTKKNTFAHRTYHNVTARYNGYFYAKESIKEGVFKLETAHKDDYTRILPIYKLSDEQAAKSIYPEMDRAYQKASTVIQRHSIMLKNVEYVKWIEDNYLAIGISHYYKRDYFPAMEVFDYMIKQYKKSEIKYDAMIWLLRSYNEGGIVSKAQQIMDVLENDKKLPKKLKGPYDLAVADFYLKRENYPMAAKHLERGLPNIKKKKEKVRAIFILAQLYQKTGENRKSSSRFTEVIKLNPEYVMTFQAKINLAKSFDGNSRNKKDIIAQLFKMLKDKKNEEYFDQIYYALAEIELKDNNTNQAIEYLKKSVSASTTNNQQKSFSYLMLGEIYFKSKQYVPAQAYYDSTFSFLPSTYYDYENLMSKKNHLTTLITNLNTIAMEDSLQRIAKMGEAQREKYIDDLITKLVAQEEKRIQEEEEKKKLSSQQIGLNAGAGNNPPGGGGQTGAVWYFYNSTALSFGFNEFRKKWGERTLEDNWRRSIKDVNLFANNEDEEGELSDSSEVAAGTSGIDAIKNREKYLKDLPISEEKMQKSTEKIIESYYTAGTIYKEQLADNESAIDLFEEFIKRFPAENENKYLLPSYYQIYRCCINTGNEKKSEHYKNILLNRHPESEYSRIIRNPESKGTNASANEIEDFYSKTYQSYLNGEFSLVFNNCLYADSVYSKSPFSPKFDFLKAMAIGKLKGIDAFESALKEIVVRHPNTDVKERAEEMLQYISQLKPQPKDTVASKYKYDVNASHNCVLIVPESVDMNSLKIVVSDFNTVFFSNEKLTITNLNFNESFQMVSISGLENKKTAMNYYDAIKENESVLAKCDKNLTPMAISTENFSVFYKEKDINEYMVFFNKKYLNIIQ
jgi:outer membrane protein assembly factor BamD (BamD/ComL family)